MTERLTTTDCFDLWISGGDRDRMAHVIEGFVRTDGVVDVAMPLLSAMGIGYTGGGHYVADFAREMGFKATCNKTQTMFRFSRGGE
jgi:hypothetical protein